MRSRAILLVVVALAALGSASWAQDEKAEDVKLPWNPWATAAVGDWSVYSSRFTGEGAPPMKSTMSHVVEKIEGDKLTLIGTEARNGKPSEKRETRDIKTLSLEAMLGKNAPPFKSVKITEEKRKVGDKEFACTKLTGLVPQRKVQSGEPAGDSTLTFWMSKDVKAGSLVAMEMGLKGPKGDVMMVMEVQGFGSKDKTVWGKSIAEVMPKAEASEGKKGEGK
jgi:hypothetical protein